MKHFRNNFNYQKYHSVIKLNVRLIKFIEKIPLDRENFVSQSLLQKKILTTLVQIIYLLEYISKKLNYYHLKDILFWEVSSKWSWRMSLYIYIKNNIVFKNRSDLSKLSVESIWIEIDDEKKSKLSVMVFYFLKFHSVINII